MLLCGGFSQLNCVFFTNNCFVQKLVSQYGFHNFAPKSRYDEKGSNQVKVLDIWKNEMEQPLC